MYIKTVTYMSNLMNRFREEEDGLALTEYVILLGLLTAAVIAAVTLFGGNLATVWEDWAEWMGGLTGGPAVEEADAGAPVVGGE